MVILFIWNVIGYICSYTVAPQRTVMEKVLYPHQKKETHTVQRPMSPLSLVTRIKLPKDENQKLNAYWVRVNPQIYVRSCVISTTLSKTIFFFRGNNAQSSSGNHLQLNGPILKKTDRQGTLSLVNFKL